MDAAGAIRIIDGFLATLSLILGVILWRKFPSINGYAVPVVLLMAHKILFYIVGFVLGIASIITTWMTILQLHEGLTWLIYLVFLPIFFYKKL